MKIGRVALDSPLVVSPMAGMTDTAFRRLVKRHGGCGLVVTEMVSSEGLVRGIDRTLEYAEYTEEERPVSIQIFGGEPDKMAEAARIVEGMGADIVDINMGCPVAKISKHNAGCSLMREPDHAATIVAAMVKAVNIPVTVKMRKGWDENETNAPDVARRVEDAGASAITIHGRTAKQSYTGIADWEFVARVADALTIPVFGSGDCIEPEQIVERLRPTSAHASAGKHISGVFVGRGVLRNPWILAQAQDLLEGRPARVISMEERGQFLLDYIELLQDERVHEERGFRHVAPGTRVALSTQHLALSTAPRHDRWVINKTRALCSWYSKGLDNGSHLRTAVNAAASLPELKELIESFFAVREGALTAS
ncbi:MAG TPA: tRNA dihydrouridine synthase DusB [Vicinamibacterales bacterium]|nr:tRNA dihydrouridine synthase DusB [Vicinamibacterales bacterium]